jgi:uncharacterized membrane protein
MKLKLNKQNRLLYAYIMDDLWRIAFGLANIILISFWYVFRHKYFLGMGILGFVMFVGLGIIIKKYIKRLENGEV